MEYRIGDEVFPYKKEANQYCVARGIDKDTITKIVDPGPLGYTLANVKKTLISIAIECNSHDGNIYISGKTNFRDKVAVTHPYKGTRDVTHKPVYYQEIKDYLIDHWDAIVVEGMEADDAMGIYQYQNLPTVVDQMYLMEGDIKQTCICTIDKDLDMIPGWHYNFRKGEMYLTTLEESDYFFHTQMLTGDRVDNIMGIKGIGPVKANKLLKGKSFEEREHIIFNEYKKFFGQQWPERHKENEQLLWILREPRVEDVREEL